MIDVNHPLIWAVAAAIIVLGLLAEFARRKRAQRRADARGNPHDGPWSWIDLFNPAWLWRRLRGILRRDRDGDGDGIDLNLDGDA